jgi:hypothetical protein
MGMRPGVAHPSNGISIRGGLGSLGCWSPAVTVRVGASPFRSTVFLAIITAVYVDVRRRPDLHNGVTQSMRSRTADYLGCCCVVCIVQYLATDPRSLAHRILLTFNHLFTKRTKKSKDMRNSNRHWNQNRHAGNIFVYEINRSLAACVSFSLPSFPYAITRSRRRA